MSKIDDLKKERNEAAAIIEEMRNDDTKIDGTDSLNEERWAKTNEAYDAADKQIKKHERADEIAKAQAASENERTGRDTQRGGEAKHDAHEDRSLAMQGWMRSQRELAPSDEQRAAAQRVGVNLNSRSFDVQLGDTRAAKNAQAEHRALSVGTTTAGGFTVPEGFVPSLEKSMLHYGGMLQVSDIMRTETGNTLPWPTANDTGNSGVLLAENTQVAEQDITFGEVQFNAYKYSSKLVRVSSELLTDSAFNMASEVGSMLGERLGRILNAQFTTGTGTAQPNGVVTAASSGKVAASASAITFDEIIDLEHSVDPAYRQNGSYMFEDSILLLLRKLKGTSNEYLWNNAINGAGPTINGRPYTINQDMASVAVNAKVALFGDFSKYKVRQVNNVKLVHMTERYGDYDQEGFVAFLRADGDLLDSGTDPMKYLAMAAA